jgi:hypothetical protein
MNGKVLWQLTKIAILALALSGGLMAQAPRPVALSGTISDYNPFSNGQYEMRGTWSLKVNGDSSKAEFSAALNMEHSDLWMISNNTTDTTLRDPHTHHITMRDAQVIFDQNYITANCPTAHYVVATTTGFAVTGMASVTGDGGHAPFAPHGELSPLTVCVTGGPQVGFSNITLQLGSPASKHFGTQAINGVVRRVKPQE